MDKRKDTWPVKEFARFKPRERRQKELLNKNLEKRKVGILGKKRKEKHLGCLVFV